LHATSPATAAYLTMLGRVLGGLNVAVGLLGVAVVLGGLRRGAAWAWYALLMGNAFGYGAPIAFDLTVRHIGRYERLELGLAALVLLALARSARPVLPGRANRAGQVACRLTRSSERAFWLGRPTRARKHGRTHEGAGTAQAGRAPSGGAPDTDRAGPPRQATRGVRQASGRG
jgi:hypothetical protein